MTTQEPIRVAVSGTAGRVGYSLVFRIAAGGLFGREQPVALGLLELPEAQCPAGSLRHGGERLCVSTADRRAQSGSMHRKFSRERTGSSYSAASHSRAISRTVSTCSATMPQPWSSTAEPSTRPPLGPGFWSWPNPATPIA